jgi:hypothetical protein
MTFTIGENVGAYRIVQQLGQGGMATVFKAYHAALDRYVALKVMHAAFKADATFLARFQREARVVARLEHPNIVPVYDYAEHDGSPYLVMKFIEGETLKARLARGRLSMPEIRWVIEGVGAALDYAHKQGILHRDIKPSNVMLARDGSLYLADFGLARIAMAGESTLSADTMLGTPHYMSPEQAKGLKDLNACTDIYSFGVVAYELTVGRVPFNADTPFAIIHDHIFTPLPMPRVINPALSEDVERVLLKALAKERQDRYCDVAAFVRAFLDASASQAGGATAAARDDTRVAPSGGGTAAGAGAAVPAATVLVQPPDAASASQAAAPTVMAAPTGMAPGSGRGPAAETAAPAVMPAASAASRPASEAALGSAPAVAPVAGVMPAPPAAESAPKAFPWVWVGVAGLALVLLVVLGGLTMLGGLAQKSHAAIVTAAARLTAAAIVPATPVVQASPAAPDLGTLFSSAGQAFDGQAPDKGFALLDAAVALGPNNPGVLLQAGDMALAHGAQFALRALASYYGPALKIERNQADNFAGPVTAHTTLALYALAKVPDAGQVLTALVAQSTDQPEWPLVAKARWDLYAPNADLNGVGKEVTDLLATYPHDPVLYLIRGDLNVRQKHPVLAGEDYLRAQKNVSKDTPPWVLTEAQCKLKVVQANLPNPKLEPTCENLSLLVTGK